MTARRGARAEAVAAWWLRLKGYRVCARRFAAPEGEIDLVVRRGRVLAFVEVKARPTPAAALNALTRRQQRRIARAARRYRQRHPGTRHLSPRFDVVVLAPRARPRHLPDAFHAPDMAGTPV